MLRKLVELSKKDERGQALVVFVGGFVIFLGLVAMSVDVGRLV